MRNQILSAAHTFIFVRFATKHYAQKWIYGQYLPVHTGQMDLPQWAHLVLDILEMGMSEEEPTMEELIQRVETLEDSNRNLRIQVLKLKLQKENQLIEDGLN